MSKIFILNEGKAAQLHEEPYKKEVLLQDIIAKNPDLLLRDSRYESERLFLIKQEQSVSVEEGNTTYFLDHLFVDSSGIPVLVEVKRSSDNRIKREVVAQMLDYASRVRLWDTRKLRENFRKINEGDSEILEKYDTDEFWKTVGTNLQAENMRLIFAADEIPDTLKTLIDFMDRIMRNITVYGVEIHQFKGADGTMLLSTNIIGNSGSVIVDSNSSIEQQKLSSPTHQWTMEEFKERLQSIGGDSYEKLGEELCESFKRIGYLCEFGIGAAYPRYLVKLNWNGQLKTIFSIIINIKNVSVEIWRMDLIKSLGPDISASAFSSQPQKTDTILPFDILLDSENKQRFLELVEEFYKKAADYKACDPFCYPVS